MKKNWKHYLSVFLVGAVLYPLIEVLFRGYTHFSMVILGGICLLAIYWVDEMLYGVRKIWKAILCTILITQMEFICGILVNRLWKMNVWDYSHLPFQFGGQICLLFSFFWFLLSYGALVLLSLERKSRRTSQRGQGAGAASEEGAPSQLPSA